MQSRQRNPSDGFRSGSSSRISPDGRHGMYNSGSNYRNYGRGGGGGGGGGFSRGGHQKPPSSYLPPPPPPPPPPRKIDILMEAGRLAAEYLVAKGLLPPKWPNNSRETAAPEGRTSALARLGSSDGRRRYNDEYNSRSNSRGRRRMGPYNGGSSSSSRGYGSDYGRENGRNGPWSGRGRGYSESVEGEDDYAPGYRKDRRSELDEGASSVSRAADERHSKSEVTGESGSEVGTHEMADDSGSKASSSSTRKEAQLEVDVELDKVVDNAGVVNSEKRDEGKSEASGDSKKQSVSAEELGGRPCEAEGEPVSADGGKDLLKLCSFKKVPTRPRSALMQRNTKIDQGLPTEVRNPVEDTSLGVEKVAQGERPMGESLSDSHQRQTETLELQAPETSHILSVQPVEESLKKHESNLSPPGFGPSEQLVEVSKEITQREGIKRQREPSSENENSRLHNLRVKQSSPAVDSIQVDEEMVTAVAVDQEKQGSAAFFPKIEPELNLQMEGDKQILPSSFKICDLNLMGTPEITEIPDDPVMDHLHTSPTLETRNELAVDFGLSIGKNANDSNDYSRLSDDDKVVPIIDLEQDSPIEGGDCDTSKQKNETIYSSLDDFMTHEENADLPGMQDGYLTISEYLHNDISACPPVSPDLNNLQTGLSLDNGEGVNGDDDSIYVSLEEIPIGFMEVWDQPPQDYGKFF